MRKARFLFTEYCLKNCSGCCNKFLLIKPKKITIKELKKYDEIYITGGEPMLFQEELRKLIKKIKTKTNKIFLYTAFPYPISFFKKILKQIDGATVTIHDKFDKVLFLKEQYDYIKFPKKSLWLNTFINIKLRNYNSWKIRKRKWIKYCPLPDGEEFVCF